MALQTQLENGEPERGVQSLGGNKINRERFVSEFLEIVTEKWNLNIQIQGISETSGVRVLTGDIQVYKGQLKQTRIYGVRDHI